MIQATKFISVPLLILSIVCLVAMPRAVGTAAVQSIDVFIDIVLPAIFPFIIISTLLSSTKAGYILSIPLRPFCKYILGVPSNLAPAVLASVTGGYLAGLTSLVGLRDSGQIDNSCAENCLHFLILPSPPIAITAVGLAMLGSYELGVLIFLSMIIASVEVRWLMMGRDFSARASTHRISITQQRYMPFSLALPSAIAKAGATLPIMLASILTANIMINILTELKILNLIGMLIFRATFGIINMSDIVLGVGGFIEICSALSQGASVQSSYGYLIMSFLIAFSSFSVILQIVSLASTQGLSVKGLVYSRMLHAFLTCVNLFPVFYIYNKFVPVMQTGTPTMLVGGSVFFESLSMLGLTAMLVCLAGRVCTKLQDKKFR